MRKRYALGKFGGYAHILDCTNDKVFGFGPGFDWFHVPHQQHRAAYSPLDAMHVADWLNERAAGYPPRPPR